MLRLPKTLDSDEHAQAVWQRLLQQAVAPLWEGGSLRVASVSLTPQVEQSLSLVRRSGALLGGFDKISLLMHREEVGIQALGQKSTRLNRLLLVSNDGSERFYRHCETLGKRYENRLLCLKLEADSTVLGSKFFGSGKSVKAVLVCRVDAVVRVMLSIGEEKNKEYESS
jgi:hypothetical protein